MSDSQGFSQLNKGVQKWIWAQKWTELRDIQEKAISPILKGNTDVIISASTAAGKTEAAFLPICSHLADNEKSGFGVLYISPLKALINDQYRRLESLCELTDLSLTPWHGDISKTVKDKARKNPSGILLITPESLEAQLINKSSWSKEAYSQLSYIIIDEFHAFLGSERGCQLQSLMHRLEFMLERKIPRIALSATLGDMHEIAKHLRPDGSLEHQIIKSDSSHSDLKIQFRGYIEKTSADDSTPLAQENIVNDLYDILRCSSHLVFANSRGRTEEIAASLRDLCDDNSVPNEFFPHHGSLSKDLREELESRLQDGKLPTTAVCTMTLELGIDIGNVESIAQVMPPHSVASLRQRLGRSGRRGDAAILRLFITEKEITSKSHIIDRIRLQSIQCVAMVNLLLKKWYEPAPKNNFHLSTLVQQTLAVIAQYGGVRADQLWELLCSKGPFSEVDQQFYSQILRGLGEHELITQLQSGEITLGVKGERVVGHYTFYTAFNTPEEYRLVCNGKTLGTVPIDKPLMVDEHIIFAGKRWKVLSIDPEKKVIELKASKGGLPPKFGGEGQAVHDIVRQEMKRVYMERAFPIYLDSTAKSFFSEGLDEFYMLNLDKSEILEQGNTIHIFPWLGDRTTATIALLLRMNGLNADCYGGVIDITKCSKKEYKDIVSNIINNPMPTTSELANNITDTIVDKHDIYLSREVRDIAYGEKYFDVISAYKWFENTF